MHKLQKYLSRISMNKNNNSIFMAHIHIQKLSKLMQQLHFKHNVQIAVSLNEQSVVVSFCIKGFNELNRINATSYIRLIVVN